MAFAYPWTAAVSLIALAVYFMFAANVGRARVRHKVVAPATDGPPEFMRIYRVQQNTVEQLVLYIPALWLCAVLTGDIWAAILGTLWPIGRIVYAASYYRAAEKRGPGFLITLASSMLLWTGALIGLIASQA